jgi:hypothetical protein
MGAAATSGASAAVNLTNSTAFDSAPLASQTAFLNFDTPSSSLLSYTGGYVGQGSSPGWYAAPANDDTNFGYAESGHDFNLLVAPGNKLNSLSFYLGSLDSYNTLSFYDGATLVKSYNGGDLTPDPSGDQGAGSTNRRYFFTFGAADDVNKVVFSSASPAFEFDNIAAAVSAVPEPATWTMMIFGFGFLGFMLRGNRRRTLGAATA